MLAEQMNVRKSSLSPLHFTTIVEIDFLKENVQKVKEAKNKTKKENAKSIAELYNKAWVTKRVSETAST